ncbi:MAG: D-glycero-beta-D-manno-heptose 1,7-bisphosphate 7-phosphatase [bacterium]|nr:D-glycero-beta-D-manno-heptose 1,7-bisphosphate 7-phosphatase [bacterium]
MSEPRPAVFLDRDGTINREVDYLSRVEDFELLPGAGEALRALQDAGFLLVVITNQSGIARGMLDEARLEEIHGEMARQLDAFGVVLDHVGHCPHHPDCGERVECNCRKPQPGLLLEATRVLEIDLTESYCVGDSLRDLTAGEALGVRGILVGTGKGEAQERTAREAGRTIEPFVADLAAASRWILAQRVPS